MLTFTFAGDEAGDTGFSFGKGSSRLFVIAVIATQNPEGLRGLLENVRQQAHLPPSFEFHFNSLASAKLRQQAFTALAGGEFEAWAIVADKTTLPEVFKVMSGLEIYLFFVTELIRQIPPEKREGGTLILDEFGSPDTVRQELRRVMKARGILHGFRRIFIRRSHSEPLIQVADLVAGALLRRDSKKDSGAFDYVQDKLRRVIEYPE